MNALRVTAVVPVKNFDEAKLRLQPVLSAGERRELARLMFEDVLAVLLRCGRLDQVAVMTADPDAARLAGALGARTLADPQAGGLPGAVAAAAAALKRQGSDAMLVVPADVPGIDVATIHRLLDSHAASPAVTLAAAERDGGTNALLCSPPDVISNCFGPNSFRAHRRLAVACGIEPAVPDLPGLRYDIDRPLDLLAFVRTPSATRTYHYLVRSGIAARLLETAFFPRTDALLAHAAPQAVPACHPKG